MGATSSHETVRVAFTVHLVRRVGRLVPDTDFVALLPRARVRVTGRPALRDIKPTGNPARAAQGRRETD